MINFTVRLLMKIKEEFGKGLKLTALLVKGDMRYLHVLSGAAG